MSPAVRQADADLPVLPVETEAFSIDPDPSLAAARRRHPWLARFSQGYVVHGYQAVADLLADDAHLHPGFGPVIDFYGLRGTLWARFMEGVVMARSGSEHRRLRASIGHAFTPRQANGLRDVMRRTIASLLDEWAPRGSFDFVAFAASYPVAVTCTMLGVSAEPVARLRTALDDQLLSVTLDPAARPRIVASWEVMWAFANGLVERREASGAAADDTLLDTMIAAKDRGDMDELELRFMVLTLIAAGYDTTKNQLSVTMRLLVDRPDLYRRCAEDLEFCGRVAEEGLRHTATVSPFREVARDFVYRDFAFAKGDKLVIATPLANRDPAVFAAPEAFDPSRANVSRHVGFGRGAHMCLGMFLARNLLQEGVHAIARRLADPVIAGAVEIRPFLGAWGYRRLPIAFGTAS